MVLRSYTFVVACCQGTFARLSRMLESVQFPPKWTARNCLAICAVRLILPDFYLMFKSDRAGLSKLRLSR